MSLRLVHSKPVVTARCERGEHSKCAGTVYLGRSKHAAWAACQCSCHDPEAA